MSAKRRLRAELAPAMMVDALEPAELAPIEPPVDGPRCCPLLDQALSFTEAFNDKPLPGLTTSHCFERHSGRYTGAQLTYHLPAKGRGKARTQSSLLVCRFCPFCGKEQESAKDLQKGPKLEGTAAAEPPSTLATRGAAGKARRAGK